MSDYYQFLSSMAGAGEQPNLSSADASPSAPQPVLGPGSRSASNPYQNLSYFGNFPEPLMFNSSSKTQRSRRKSAPGPDHIKHRRTRSGCYTCRSRRVKCDETHPICERCRKGKRECVYPESPAPKGSSSQSAKDGSGHSQQTSPSSSREDDEDETEQDSRLEPIIDEEVYESQSESVGAPPSSSAALARKPSTTPSLTLQRTRPFVRQGSDTSSQEGSKSSSPLVATGTTTCLTPSSLHSAELPTRASTAGALQPDWSFLPHELQFYLKYFCENITHFHYCLVNDSHNFFQSTLPSIALRDEALLFAIVGFAAYHHTIENSCGHIKEFLQYYNRSVTLLLGFLKKKEKYNIGTLLTILQLATIEEYLGDWVNLMNHQKAAFEVLTQLFTPRSIVQSPAGRMILRWYCRFDVFVGLMGGFEAALPTEWFLAALDYCDSQALADPDSFVWKIEARAARLRLISMEMSVLSGKGSRSELSEEAYSAEHQRISKELHVWKDDWDPALADPAYMVTDFGSEYSLPPDDIVNPFTPGIIYNQPLFASTILTCEWHSVVIMHERQAGTAATEEDLSSRAGPHAYSICQIFEAIELWPLAPNGSLITIRACLAVAALFVPRDTRHHLWIRRKFVLLESMGYIFPITMRIRMAELFGDQACVHWWLPNEEGLTPLLKSIRMFADERNAAASTVQTENLLGIRNYFADMRLAGIGDLSRADDSPPAQSKGKGKGKDTGE